MHCREECTLAISYRITSKILERGFSVCLSASCCYPNSVPFFRAKSLSAQGGLWFLQADNIATYYKHGNNFLGPCDPPGMLRAVGGGLGRLPAPRSSYSEALLCRARPRDAQPGAERPSRCRSGGVTSAFEVVCPQLAELANTSTSVIYQKRGEGGRKLQHKSQSGFILLLKVLCL